MSHSCLILKRSSWTSEIRNICCITSAKQDSKQKTMTNITSCASYWPTPRAVGSSKSGTFWPWKKIAERRAKGDEFKNQATNGQLRLRHQTCQNTPFPDSTGSNFMLYAKLNDQSETNCSGRPLNMISQKSVITYLKESNMWGQSELVQCQVLLLILPSHPLQFTYPGHFFPPNLSFCYILTKLYKVTANFLWPQWKRWQGFKKILPFCAP